MTKTVLLLHGWPQSIEKDSMYFQYFENKGYGVITPEIFSKDFVLSATGGRKYVEEQLGGKKPDVIVGISLGGLLAPVIAKDYPDSKMILIATGPKLEPKAPGFKMILDLVKNKPVLRIFDFLRFLPQKVLFAFYELINPFKGGPLEKKIYEDDMRKNFKYIMQIPMSEEEEIVSFVTEVDNTELLKTLKNKTLIFTSENDLMMPANLGSDLHRLLLNSRIVINGGGHFNVFTRENFQDVDRFLSE